MQRIRSGRSAELWSRLAAGIEVSTGPVEHRHEVVAHGANTALRQVAQSLLIVSDRLLIVASLGFDIFRELYAFHDILHQACIFNDRLAFEDLFLTDHTSPFGIWCKAVTTPVAPA